jgi:hypothetical protein
MTGVSSQSETGSDRFSLMQDYVNVSTSVTAIGNLNFSTVGMVFGGAAAGAQVGGQPSQRPAAPLLDRPFNWNGGWWQWRSAGGGTGSLWYWDETNRTWNPIIEPGWLPPGWQPSPQNRTYWDPVNNRWVHIVPRNFRMPPSPAIPPSSSMPAGPPSQGGNPFPGGLQQPRGGGNLFNPPTVWRYWGSTLDPATGQLRSVYTDGQGHFRDSP